MGYERIAVVLDGAFAALPLAEQAELPAPGRLGLAQDLAAFDLHAPGTGEHRRPRSGHRPDLAARPVGHVQEERLGAKQGPAGANGESPGDLARRNRLRRAAGIRRIRQAAFLRTPRAAATISRI